MKKTGKLSWSIVLGIGVGFAIIIRMIQVFRYPESKSHHALSTTNCDTSRPTMKCKNDIMCTK